jgi:hypothetical protein
LKTACGILRRETRDADPLKIAEDALPLYVEIGQLRQLGEAQARAYELLASTFEKAGKESKDLNSELRADLLTQRRRAIADTAMDKGREIHREMVERAKMAMLTREFYEPASVRQRAILSDPRRAGDLVTCLDAAPPVALLGYAKLALGTRDAILAAVTLQVLQARQATVPDNISNPCTKAILALPLPESDEGRKLVIDITGDEQDAQIAIASYATGRGDEVSKIARGLRARGD